MVAELEGSKALTKVVYGLIDRQSRWKVYLAARRVERRGNPARWRRNGGYLLIASLIGIGRSALAVW
jgi:hypothetical protein